MGKQVLRDGLSSTLAPSLLGAAASWLSSCLCIKAVGREQAGVATRCGRACGACHKLCFIANSLLALRSDVGGKMEMLGVQPRQPPTPKGHFQPD